MALMGTDVSQCGQRYGLGWLPTMTVPKEDESLSMLKKYPKSTVDIGEILASRVNVIKPI